MEREPLTAILCQSIIVETTPNPGRSTGDPEQQLLQLGIVDDARAGVHRVAIREDLQRRGYDIRPVDIVTGPAVSVGDARDAVFDNAK
jgi:hypothetical protein